MNQRNAARQHDVRRVSGCGMRLAIAWSVASIATAWGREKAPRVSKIFAAG